MIDRKTLLADLRGEVTRLEDDLREQVETVNGLKPRLQAEHSAATKARRTAATSDLLAGRAGHPGRRRVGVGHGLRALV